MESTVTAPVVRATATYESERKPDRWPPDIQNNTLVNETLGFQPLFCQTCAFLLWRLDQTGSAQVLLDIQI